MGRKRQDPDKTLVDDPAIMQLVNRLKKKSKRKSCNSKPIDEIFVQFKKERLDTYESLKSRLFDKEIDPIPSFQPLVSLVQDNVSSTTQMSHALIDLCQDYQNSMNELEQVQQQQIKRAQVEYESRLNETTVQVTQAIQYTFSKDRISSILDLQ